jgi:hypothetical protein
VDAEGTESWAESRFLALDELTLHRGRDDLVA